MRLSVTILDNNICKLELTLNVVHITNRAVARSSPKSVFVVGSVDQSIIIFRVVQVGSTKGMGNNLTGTDDNVRERSPEQKYFRIVFSVADGRSTETEQRSHFPADRSKWWIRGVVNLFIDICPERRHNFHATMPVTTATTFNSFTSFSPSVSAADGCMR